MEYNVLKTGELVPCWESGYVPESIPPSRANMKVVLVPTAYHGIPEQQFHTLQHTYQAQEGPYQSFQTPPRRSLPTMHQTFQAQNILEPAYQSLQAPPRRGLQIASQPAQNRLEVPYQSFQDSSYTTLQTQSLPAPIQSIEDVFSTNINLTNSNEILTGQDTRPEESFDIHMATPLEGVEERATVTETSSDSVCRSCGEHQNLKGLVKLLLYDPSPH